MSKIKVHSVTKGEPPCPPPAPKPAPMPRPAPTDAPHPYPPPPPFFTPGPCCPGTTQVVDNVTVKSITPDTIEVLEGTYMGMKAFGVGTKVFAGIGTSGTVPTPTTADRNKVLASDGTWAEIIVPEQEQSDWKQDDDTKPDYIKNKPGEFSGIGTSGFVPTPTDEDKNKVLASDGTWAEIIIPEQEQVDWKQDDDTKPDYIKNKPGEFSGIGTSGFVPTPTDEDKNKVLASDGTWAEIIIPEQEQSDWNQSDTAKPDYIKNKPTEFAGVGTSGFVPTPTELDTGKFLSADGTWQFLKSGVDIDVRPGDKVTVEKEVTEDGTIFTVSAEVPDFNEITDFNVDDYVAIVQTYSDLIEWDTSDLVDGDRAAVIHDETHEDVSYVYKWVIVDMHWEPVGRLDSEGGTVIEGAVYTSGKWINISQDNEISVDEELIAGKIDKISDSTEGNLPLIDGEGSLVDSGTSLNDLTYNAGDGIIINENNTISVDVDKTKDMLNIGEIYWVGLGDTWYDIVKAQLQGKVAKLRLDIPGLVCITSDAIPTVVPRGDWAYNAIGLISNADMVRKLMETVEKAELLSNMKTINESLTELGYQTIEVSDIDAIFDETLPLERLNQVFEAMDVRDDDDELIQFDSYDEFNEFFDGVCNKYLSEIKTTIHSVLETLLPPEILEKLDLETLETLDKEQFIELYIEILRISPLTRNIDVDASLSIVDFNIGDILTVLGLELGDTLELLSLADVRIGLGLRYNSELPLPSPTYIAFGAPDLLCVSDPMVKTAISAMFGDISVSDLIEEIGFDITLPEGFDTLSISDLLFGNGSTLFSAIGMNVSLITDETVPSGLTLEINGTTIRYEIDMSSVNKVLGIDGGNDNNDDDPVADEPIIRPEIKALIEMLLPVISELSFDLFGLDLVERIEELLKVINRIKITVSVNESFKQVLSLVRKGWNASLVAFPNDSISEFAEDPTRITLIPGRIGVLGTSLEFNGIMPMNDISGILGIPSEYAQPGLLMQKHMIVTVNPDNGGIDATVSINGGVRRAYRIQDIMPFPDIFMAATEGCAGVVSAGEQTMWYEMNPIADYAIDETTGEPISAIMVIPSDDTEFYGSLYHDKSIYIITPQYLSEEEIGEYAGLLPFDPATTPICMITECGKKDNRIAIPFDQLFNIPISVLELYRKSSLPISIINRDEEDDYTMVVDVVNMEIDGDEVSLTLKIDDNKEYGISYISYLPGGDVTYQVSFSGKPNKRIYIKRAETLISERSYAESELEMNGISGEIWYPDDDIDVYGHLLSVMCADELLQSVPIDLVLDYNGNDVVMHYSGMLDNSTGILTYRFAGIYDNVIYTADIVGDYDACTASVILHTPISLSWTRDEQIADSASYSMSASHMTMHVLDTDVATSVSVSIPDIVGIDNIQSKIMFVKGNATASNTSIYIDNGSEHLTYTMEPNTRYVLDVFGPIITFTQL